jgi:hypothetical protein
MTATIKFYDINYNNKTSNLSTSKRLPISPAEYSNRMPSEVLETLEMYPSLRFFGEFLERCWTYSPLFPATTRVLAARLFSTMSKLLSALHYELPAQTSVIHEIYLVQLKASCNMISEWMIKHQVETTKSSTVDGGVVLELTPTGYSLFSELSSWSLFENIYINNSYSKSFIVDHKFQQLITNINFKF